MNDLQLGNHLVASVQTLHSLSDHLVNDCLCGLSLIDDRGRLAHEERSSIVHSVIIDIIAKLLEIVLNWDGA
jgi:hypothetical protein